MTRELKVIDSRDVPAVIAGLREALAGDGPAILPHPRVPEGLPAEVEQRVAVVVETSGSTARPKRVALSADALLASAAAADVRLGGPGQWLLPLSAHYIAGLNVLVRSLAAQTEPVIMDPEGFTAARFSEAAAGMTGQRRYTSMVPAQLARLVADDSVLEVLRSFDRIVVGGQAMPQRLLELSLESGLNVTRTYGSSETCGGCVWDGIPIGDTEVRVVDDRIELAGSVLAEGYLGDPKRTGLHFVESGGKRWYRTDDVGSLTDGVLKVSGRADDVIVSGGVKVSLAEVELAVRSLPALGEAVVVAVPHPDWGEVPLVVATSSPPLEAVRAAIATELGPAAAPDRVLLVDRIPLLASGKPDRLAIAALALG